MTSSEECLRCPPADNPLRVNRKLAAGKRTALYNRNLVKLRRKMLPERFFVHHVGHVRGVTAVIGFEDVDDPLNAAASHPRIRIGGEACDAAGAGKVREKAD